MARTKGVHLNASANRRGASSDQICTAKEWKRLWGIKAPPKMNIVPWRFAHNCLPAGQQLKNRNIAASSACCHCGREEFVEHAFLICQYVAEMWRELKQRCGFKIMHRTIFPARQWLFNFPANSTEKEATQLTISFWHIWEARNVVCNGECEVHPHCMFMNQLLPTGVTQVSLKDGLHRRKDGLR